MSYEPGLSEDTKNLSLITGPAVVALLLTVGAVGVNVARGPSHDHAHSYQPAPAAVTYDIDMGPVSGSNRLYGRVMTRDGAEYTGFIRWDKNEGSWADLLDATKVTQRGTSTISGVRFGNIHRIEVAGRNSARLVLKTGEDVHMQGRATDLGSGLRALIVTSPAGQEATMDWRSLDFVEFFPAPENARADEARMYGTLTTRAGDAFTGYVAWDVDEIYSTDVLDGEAEGIDHEIPFGAIESIERVSSAEALVVLRSGEALTLSGTNDVNRENNGITVSDIGLGQVKIDWGDLDNVRFHLPDEEPGYGLFDGGQRLVGTVVTESGEEFSGGVSWDNDEAFAWEMLNGKAHGVDFQVEFSNIVRITKIRDGALVELRDGRTLALSDSNDVDAGNRGITIEQGSGAHEVEWQDFQELTLNR